MWFIMDKCAIVPVLKITICEITYMAACDSVEETCGEFWIQK